jgi:signal transduction histidine kinase
MRSAAKGKRITRSFEEEFVSALREYVLLGGEESLGFAYELGRRGINDGKSLMEVVSIHHKGLLEILGEVEDKEKRAELLRSSVHFLIESLSSYEMARRGFQDAVKTLRRFNETLEEEIKRMAHALHDDAGQLLVAVHLALADLSDGLPTPKQALITKIKQSLDQAERQLRHYSHELRPTVLDDLGLVPGIRFLAGAVSKRTSLSIQVKTRITKRLPSAMEIALFRVVQEALNNIAKHAKATRVSISLFGAGSFTCCEVKDDGAGFDVQATRRDPKQRGLGLIGMEERVNAIGGTLTVISSPGLGTKLLIRLPMAKEDN